MVIVHHRDRDGEFSAMQVAEEAKLTDNYGIRLVSLLHPDGLESFKHMVRKNEQVYIVDYSIKPSEMTELLKITENVTWIDHHASAIKLYDGYHREIRGLRNPDWAACELVHSYLTYMTDGGLGDIKEFDHMMMNTVPKVVELVGVFDSWRKEDPLRDTAMEFIAGTEQVLDALSEHKRLEEIRNLIYVPYKMSDNTTKEDIIEKGKVIRSYQKAMRAEIIEKYAYEVDMMGLHGLACNAPIFTSELFGDRLKDYDFGCAYVELPNGDYKIRLYSCTMDILPLAESLGGGGHSGAAGTANMKELPFTKHIERGHTK